MPTRTAEMPLTFGASYHVKSTCDFTNGTSFFVTSLPMPSAKENHLIAEKLGRHGFQRIQEFRDYVPGWDFTRGQPMSEIALSGLCQFLKHAILPAGKRPSVFLTSAGHLELAWENQAGGKIQAEFGPKNIEYYREDTGLEGELAASEFSRAAKLLSA